MALLEQRLGALDSLLAQHGTSTIDQRRGDAIKRAAIYMALRGIDSESDIDTLPDMDEHHMRGVLDELMALQSDLKDHPQLLGIYFEAVRRAETLLAATRDMSVRDIKMFLQVVEKHRHTESFKIHNTLYPSLVVSGIRERKFEFANDNHRKKTFRQCLHSILGRITGFHYGEDVPVVNPLTIALIMSGRRPSRFSQFIGFFQSRFRRSHHIHLRDTFRMKAAIGPVTSRPLLLKARPTPV